MLTQGGTVLEPAQNPAPAKRSSTRAVFSLRPASSISTCTCSIYSGSGNRLRVVLSCGLGLLPNAELDRLITLLLAKSPRSKS